MSKNQVDVKGLLACPKCGENNYPGQLRCAKCGDSLRPLHFAIVTLVLTLLSLLVILISGKPIDTVMALFWITTLVIIIRLRSGRCWAWFGFQGILILVVGFMIYVAVYHGKQGLALPLSIIFVALVIFIYLHTKRVKGFCSLR